MKQKVANNFLYILEAIGCFFVVFLHCGFPGKIGIEINLISRFAVPLFLMVSGYYNYYSSKENFRHRIFKMLRLLLLTIIIYLGYNYFQHKIFGFPLAPVNLDMILAFIITTHSQFIVAGHAWFLLTMIYIYIIFPLLPEKIKKILLIFPLLAIIIFYLLQVLIPNINILIISRISRNWLTFGLPFFYIGYLIKKYEEKIKISNIKCIILMILGMICLNLEYIIMHIIFNFNYISELYVGTIIFVVSLFILAVKNPNFINFKPLKIIGEKYTLIIYVIHYIFIFIINNILINYYGLSINQVLVPFIVLFISILFSIMIPHLKKITYSIIKRMCVLNEKNFKKS